MKMRNKLMAAVLPAVLGGMPLSARAHVMPAVGAMPVAVQVSDDAADWQEAYRTAKQPLVEAMLRFERDYNDGANGPLRPMSGAAWDALLEAVVAAAEAKDVTDSYDGFAGAASALNDALDAAEQSIRLYALHTKLATALRTYDAEEFSGLADAAEAEDNKATDEALRASVEAMDEAFRAYALRLGTPLDAGRFLGENLDFETGQGMQDTRFPSVFVQPGWDTQFSGAATDDNVQYTHLERLTYGETARPSGVESDHYLYLRSRWMTEDGTVRVMKETALPSGTYTLSFYLKTSLSEAKENLCYYVLDGVKKTVSSVGLWRKRSYTLELDKPSELTLSFGFTGGNGSKNAEIWLDDVALELTEMPGDEGNGIARTTVGRDPLLAIVAGRGHLRVSASTDIYCEIHTIDGVQVCREPLKAGESRAWSLPSGVYVVNGSKVVLP